MYKSIFKTAPVVRPEWRIVRQPVKVAVWRWVLVAAGMPLLALMLLPIIAIMLRTPPSLLLRYIGDSTIVQAVGLSLSTSLVSLVVVVVLGTPLAYILARWRFRGRRVFEVLIDLPTVLPPAVAGLALLMAFGRRGLLGGVLTFFDVQIAFTQLAVIIAQVFVSASLYVKACTVSLGAINVEVEQAAAIDGARSLQVFRYITMPLAWRGIVGGAALAWARSLGEFGATIIFAGNYPGRTQTMPLMVYLSFELDMSVALTLAAILLSVSFCLLAVVRTMLRDHADD